MISIFYVSLFLFKTYIQIVKFVRNPLHIFCLIFSDILTQFNRIILLLSLSQAKSSVGKHYSKYRLTDLHV